MTNTQEAWRVKYEDAIADCRQSRDCTLHIGRVRHPDDWSDLACPGQVWCQRLSDVSVCADAAEYGLLELVLTIISQPLKLSQQYCASPCSPHTAVQLWSRDTNVHINLRSLLTPLPYIPYILSHLSDLTPTQLITAHQLVLLIIGR